MTNNTNNLEKRYSSAMRKIGGPNKLLYLPSQVQEALKAVKDFETKVKMLELIEKSI